MFSIFKSLFKFFFELFDQDDPDFRQEPPPPDMHYMVKSELNGRDVEEAGFAHVRVNSIEHYFFKNKDTKHNWIMHIRSELGQPDDKFELYFMTVFRDLARYAYLFPASQGHHHSKPLGLLRHSLQVAFYAQRLACAKNIMPKRDPSSMKSRPQWELAAVLAGLLHDVGKVYTDLIIFGENHLKYEPGIENLYEWKKKNDVSRVYYEYNINRNNREHKRYSEHFARKFLYENRPLTEYLNKYGDNIVDAIAEAIGIDGQNNSKLGAVVAEADEMSVKKDMELNGAAPSPLPNTLTFYQCCMKAFKAVLWDQDEAVNMKLVQHGDPPALLGRPS
jgi:conjugal transfer pilus assembly protein TraI